MKKHILMLLLTLGISFMGYAQKTITGNVSDQKGQPVAGATILEKGTQNGTTADDGGNFSIKVKTENAVLVISSLGYKKIEVTASGNSVSAVLEEEGQELQEVQIQTVGSRNTKRTVVDSPVAVDIINVSDVVNKTGQVEINQLLQYAAPSFNASKQSGSDGADHIDPATLRGLGPDQTLVLINGKDGISLLWLTFSVPEDVVIPVPI